MIRYFEKFNIRENIHHFCSGHLIFPERIENRYVDLAAQTDTVERILMQFGKEIDHILEKNF